MHVFVGIYSERTSLISLDQVVGEHHMLVAHEPVVPWNNSIVQLSFTTLYKIDLVNSGRSWRLRTFFPWPPSTLGDHTDPHCTTRSPNLLAVFTRRVCGLPSAPIPLCQQLDG